MAQQATHFIERVHAIFRPLVDTYGFTCGDASDNEFRVTYKCPHCRVRVERDRGQFYVQVMHPIESIAISLHSLVKYFDSNAKFEMGFFETPDSERYALDDELQKAARALLTTCRPVLIGQFQHWQALFEQGRKEQAQWLSQTEVGRQILAAAESDRARRRTV